MWYHIKTAPNKLLAETWCELLQSEGIPTHVEPDPTKVHLGNLSPQRIFVPRDKKELAEHILRNV
ncbi:MAG: DUF2007 domain-containing protein [Anaerolineae bacterium]|jgi:hypothetical protein|nr:DUF2007 domain-containing protein [Anaerolineae bacterium]MDH7475785.1 hypothetical protein [Anaerolineae bacterium]